MSTPAEQVKDRIDIVEFIRQYVALKPSGINFKGLCPFHKEKTPSFMVSPSRRNFKCFGCGKGGDIFSFLELHDGMPFVEALKFLGERAGVRLVDFNANVYSRKNRLYDLLNSAAEFYESQLLHSKEGEDASLYLSRRGIIEETRDNFLLGYAPNDWHAASIYLKQNKFADEEIKAAGISLMGTRGYYDRFRGRLMFPICDEHGRIIGFGGRVLQNREGEPKYLNSPETELYSKSKVLYAIHKAKDSIRKEGYAILVEGYMDVLANHEAGITNVVSVSGTALTDSQLSLLKRFTGTIILAFDMDNAGVSAALRSYMIAVNFGMNTKIVHLPDGKDPDELIRKNLAVWQEAIKKSDHVLEYYFRIVLKQYPINTLEGKKQARDALLPIIASIPDAVEQAHFISRLSTLLGVSANSVRNELDRINPISTLGQSESPRISGPETTETAKSHLPTREWILHLIALSIAYPRHIPKSVKLPIITIKDLSLDILYKEFYDAYQHPAFPKVYIENVKNERSASLDEFLLLASKDYPDLAPQEVEREFQRLLEALYENAIAARKAELIYEIKRVENEGDASRGDALLLELDTLLKPSLS
ncbi:MAG: DNA primase [Candidatus Jacksonbacteria bacterium]|nr:DNA primase [Candidatus Jacksonbacteria bacterium]